MPIGIPTKGIKAETYPVTTKVYISKCPIQSKFVQNFLSFVRINSFSYISSMK